MLLTATNRFTGPITVGNGTVIAWGAGQFTLANVYTGAIVISNGATFEFASITAQTNAGVISGTGTLLISNTTGSGLTLSNAVNTLAGPVVLASGALTLVSGASLGNASSVTIGAGTTFDVSQLTSPLCLAARFLRSLPAGAMLPFQLRLTVLGRST